MRAKRNIIHSLLFGAALAMSAGAHASLQLQGQEPFQGTGLGAVDTVLTLQSPGNSSTESGSVGLDGSGNQVITGDAKTGASQTKVLSFGELAINHANELLIVFNTVEPGSDQLIQLNSLELSIFSPTGTLLFASGAVLGANGEPAPLTFDANELGIGKAGFVFALDAAQAAAAEAAAFGANFNAANVIGLSASLARAQGGPETFFAVPIPEPETYAMMLAGLGLMGFIARRRERSVKMA